MFSLDDLFYVFLRLVSISLRFWNADDWEDLGCGLPDEIYALLLCLACGFGRFRDFLIGDVVQISYEE